MSERARPEGCCPLRPLRPLPEREREAAAAVFAALGDPTRLEILRLVAGQAGPVCVCDIVDRFELSQPTISHHLRVLREAGLFVQEKRGIWSFYALDPEGVALLERATELVAVPRATVTRAVARAR
jgi:ArsR family transcriptional regulator